MSLCVNICASSVATVLLCICVCWSALCARVHGCMCLCVRVFCVGVYTYWNTEVKPPVFWMQLQLSTQPLYPPPSAWLLLLQSQQLLPLLPSCLLSLMIPLLLHLPLSEFALLSPTHHLCGTSCWRTTKSYCAASILHQNSTVWTGSPSKNLVHQVVPCSLTWGSVGKTLWC